MEGDVFLVGSQFMTSVTILTSKQFMLHHGNWWSPPRAINSSPEVNLFCVWGGWCHPHWVLYCCKQAVHIISASDFKATQGAFTQHCAAFTENSVDMLRGWLRSRAGLLKALLCPAFRSSEIALPTRRRRAEEAPGNAHTGIHWESPSLGGGSSARAESCT